jgi:hypothetical protein
MCVTKKNVLSTVMCVASGWFDVPLKPMYPTSFWAFAHPNTQYLSSFDKDNSLLEETCWYSFGKTGKQLHGCQLWSFCYTWYGSCKSISIVIESLQSFHPSVFLFRAACNSYIVRRRKRIYAPPPRHSFTSCNFSKNKENIGGYDRFA